MPRTRKTETSTGLQSSGSGLKLSKHFRSSVRRALLVWFDCHKRNLPWRNDRDPYRIWVSEVMLQQTQVASVIPYFERFLNAFPTLRDLADADEQQVLRLWEGLGYYRRARDLHRAARLLAVETGGDLPNDVDVWDALPGVGRYILGAVLSQAFDRRLPIVEANSKRVLCRLFGQTGDPSSREVNNWLWQVAEALLPAKRVGDFNQALMELGALVCTSTRPQCDRCPLRARCAAFRDKTQAEIPARAPAPPVEQVREVAVVIRDGSKVLLVRRPPQGRWANMWEFPHQPVGLRETDSEAVCRMLQTQLGIRARLGQEITTIRHSVTRFRITLVAFEAKYQSGKLRPTYYKEGQWLPVGELGRFPISRPQRRLADEIAKPLHQRALF